VSSCLGAFSLAAGPARAELALEGSLVQGGLVVGRVAPGSRVAVDGAPVRVSAEGLFLLGFGRDAVGAEVAVEGPGGGREVHAVAARRRTYEEQRVDGLPERQVSPPPEDLARIRAEAELLRAARAADTPEPRFAGGIGWPLRGRISGVYGSRRILNGAPRQPHAGVDIAAPEGTTVAAAADGTAVLVHPGMFFTGITVVLDHGHGLFTVYAHMAAAAVKEGAPVRRGQAIGTVGRTGRATAPHLHWGLSLRGVALDPALAAGPMPGE
jgi:murein DD-endopeptidase MepM/ murein hydrolase activator NlpD